MNDSSWWQELVARIAKVPDDELGRRTEELVDMLDRALEAQRRGLSKKAGTKILTDSLNQVKHWLSEPENVGNPAGHFLAAYLNRFLGLSPLNLADMAQPEPKYLPLELEVPDGSTFTKNDGSSTLVLPGIMACVYLVDKPSAPTLGMLAELGEDGMKKQLVENGMSTTKAAKTVREAKSAMKNTRLSITPVCLGNWAGKRYSYHMPVQNVHHYCLTLVNRHVLITATEFKASEASLNLLERAIATMRFEPSP